MGALIFLRKDSQNAHHTPQQNFQIFIILNMIYNKTMNKMPKMPKYGMGGSMNKMPKMKMGGKLPKYGMGGKIKPTKMPRMRMK